MPRFRPKLRFSLKALLALPVVLGFGWSWWTWPDRTFERFLLNLENGRYEHAEAMLRCNDCSFAFNDDYVMCYPPADKASGYYAFAPLRFVESARRSKPSKVDVFRGERSYLIHRFLLPDASRNGGHGLLFTASLGRIEAEYSYISREEMNGATPFGKLANAAYPGK